MKPFLIIQGFLVNKVMIRASAVDIEVKHIPSRHKLTIVIREDD